LVPKPRKQPFLTLGAAPQASKIAKLSQFKDYLKGFGCHHPKPFFPF
jgi:hypothetical protein